MSQHKIAIFNNKGGVGKTTSVVNIAYNLVKLGKKILVVDCDSQKNSFGFLFQSREKELFSTKYPNMQLAIWNDVKNNIADKQGYDYVIFDLPPTITDEVKEIISFSNSVFVPCALRAFEIQGLQNVTDEINRQGAKLGGIFATMFTKRTDTKELTQIQNILKNRLLDSIIPYSPSVYESQKLGLSIEEYFIEKKLPNTKTVRKVSYAYEDLTNEILKRI